MPSTTAYAGVEQPSVASLTTAGGVFFRCYVYKNTARNTIESAIFTEQEHGQEVLVRTDTIRDVATASPGDDGDCPRVLAVGDLFVAHWLEGRSTSARDLFRSILDAGDIESGWSSQGSTPIGDHALYDAAPVEGSSPPEFVVAYQAAVATSVTVARYESPFAWVSTQWITTTVAGLAPNVLAVAADDNSVSIAYQTGQTLHMRRYNPSTGVNTANGEVFADFGLFIDDIEVCAVGLCITIDEEIAIVAEVCLAADDSGGATTNNYRSLVFKKMDPSNCTPASTAQHCPNLHLVSKPWARASGVAFTDSVYCLASFKSLTDGQEWDQSYGFVLDLDARSWTEEAAIGDVRPKPVSVLNTGALMDGRTTAASPNSNATGPGTIGKRMNHLSDVSGAPDYSMGPDATSVTVAAMFWESLVKQQDSDVAEDSLQPALASIRGVRFHHIDPWIRLDDDEPNLSGTENFRGVAAYSAGQSVAVPGGLIYGGGIMSAYDGRQLVELGFLWAPEIVSIGSGAGVVIDAGTYWYTAVYEWPDVTGRIHRSPPSRPFSVTHGADISAATVTVRCMNLSMKDQRTHYPHASPISIVLYRTALSADTSAPETAGEAPEAPGTSTSDLVFRRVFSGPAPGLEATPQSDPTVSRIVLTDAKANGVVRYTDLLPWQLSPATAQWVPSTPIPPPPASVVASWENRVWVADGDVIRYSDEHLEIGSQISATEFLSSNVFRHGRGEVIAMHPIHNALIIFTRDGIYSLTGLGNDGNGTGASLQLQVLAEGTSCTEPRSIVLGPPGIFFQSAKGYYLLAGNQSLDYDSAGASIEDLEREVGNVRAATLLEDRHEIRLVCNLEPFMGSAQPAVLIYNYEHGRWSTQPMVNLTTGLSPLNAMQAGTAWRGRQGQTCHVTLQQRGLAVERGNNDGVFSDIDHADASIPIPLDVQTEWIHLSGMAGLKIVPRFGVQTERVNAGAMSIDAWYDFVGDFDETTPDETFVFASPAPAYLLCKPMSRKFTSVMLRIYESGTVAATENVRLVSLTLEVGQKKGTRRVPATQIGT